MKVSLLFFTPSSLSPLLDPLFDIPIAFASCRPTACSVLIRLVNRSAGRSSETKMEYETAEWGGLATGGRMANEDCCRPYDSGDPSTTVFPTDRRSSNGTISFLLVLSSCSYSVLVPRGLVARSWCPVHRCDRSRINWPQRVPLPL